MNKIIIKNTALKLRKKLIESIVYKVKNQGINASVEEVAYTWFIRLVVIRFMGANKYIEYDLKDRNFSKTDFLSACNYLEEKMPSIFEKVEDNIYLLLPDDMFGENSIASDLVSGIEEYYWKVDTTKQKSISNNSLIQFEDQLEIEECGIEIVGWLHQYYFCLKKDEIFSELKKNKLIKSTIPAATQIFTPKWIVKYMVENSLGRLWIEAYSNEELLSRWKYFIKDSQEEMRILRQDILSPEEIKILDPAMGSGHILTYAFDVLYDIYLSCGYEEEKIPLLILEKNLYGLDIDDCVSKLASFAVLMKAMSRNSNILDYNPKLNLVSIQESNEIINELTYRESPILKESIYNNDIEYLVNVFHNAKEYGALLQIKEINYDDLEKVLVECSALPYVDVNEFESRKKILDKLYSLIKQGRIMSQKYDVVVANPPYSGLRKFSSTLKKFVEENYRNYKYDLFSVFIVKIMNWTKDKGFAGLMTPNVWQYISSYEDLRNYIIDNYQMLSLIQLEDDGFKDASVSISTFVIKKCHTDISSIFIKLDKGKMNQARQVEERILKENGSRFHVDQKVFKKIPGSKIAFWIKRDTMESFENGIPLEKLGKPRQGMATSDNNRFLRYWYEVNIEDIYFPNKKSKIANYKWVPYNKGGGYRKWYGNNSFVVNWQHNGYEVKEYAKNLYGNYTRTIKNERFYFKKGITYTFIGKDIAPRFSPPGFIFDVAGSMIFVDDNKLYYILGLLGSKLSSNFMNILNPSLNIQVGDIKSIPIIEALDTNLLNKIDNLVRENIHISKNDWDSFETSWDFKKHPILKYKSEDSTIMEAYDKWKTFAEYQFNKLKENEEILNSIYINIYGIKEELTPEIEDRHVTIRKANEEREIKSLISYAVGCMFGRYSLNKEGLIYAGGSFEEKFKFINEDCYVKVNENWKRSYINVTINNCIPINKSRNHDTDIVDRFINFVSIAFGYKNLENNLDYISNILGKRNNNSSTHAIKQYFIKDFFTDHFQTYQKKPIYRLINDEFGDNYLIYIHRHNEVDID